MASLPPTSTSSYSSGSGHITYSGWAGTTAAAKTLSFTAAITISVNEGSSYASASYTLDGSTWTQIFSSTTPVASTGYSVAIPSGQDLTKVAVGFTCHSTSTHDPNNSTDSEATLTISALQIA